MGNQAPQDLKTDQSLLDRLKQAASSKQTTQEKLEQRVSFIFGSLDSKSEVTREKIRQLLIEQQGETAK
jgi:hypothetical protein